MRPILSPSESAALDRESEARGITTESLMENAGHAVARAVVALTGGVYGRRAVAVCGKGNNGGDGLVAARYLARWGMRVVALLLEDPATLREPAATNFRRLQEEGIRWRPASPHTLARELGRADVAIDAIFGTGFRGIPEDDAAGAIAALNDSHAPVVAVDIPSGVNGETGAVEGDAVWAAVTVTFGAAKPGVVFFPGAARAGAVQVVDIGFPSDLVRGDLLLVEEADVAAMLPARPADAHKRSSGVVLVVGGSRAMTGAVTLVAESCYRAGAGLVNVAVTRGILPVVEAGITEATFVPLPETPEGTIDPSARPILEERLGTVDALAVGPGLTALETTAALIREVVRTSPVPAVVDADALNAFVGRAAELAERQSEAVLTPHPGEFARLTEVPSRELQEDRVGHVRKLAAAVQAVVLLKGIRTLVGSPGGQVRVNPTGGPTLATAGSGDVLTGMVAALLARGLSPVDAATAGAYLHGVAGDLAGRALGEGATARDVMERIPEAVRRVRG